MTLWRVCDRATFAGFRHHGRRVRQGPITVVWLDDGGLGPPRVAYAVSRRVGAAVARNRVRRRLRAIMQELAGTLPPGAYLVIVEPDAVTKTFGEMRTHVSTALARLGAQQ